jgi:hypothetical protein
MSAVEILRNQPGRCTKIITSLCWRRTPSRPQACVAPGSVCVRTPDHASVATAMRVPAPEYVCVACVRACVRGVCVCVPGCTLRLGSLFSSPMSTYSGPKSGPVSGEWSSPFASSGRVRVSFYCACDAIVHTSHLMPKGHTCALAQAPVHHFSDTLRCPRSCACFGCMCVLCAPACCAVCVSSIHV